MHEEQRQRTRALLHERGIHQTLFANPATVKWLTGFAWPIQLGPNPFAGGPPLVWQQEDRFTLIVVDGYEAAAADFATKPDCDVVGYSGYTVDEPIAGGQNLVNTLEAVLADSIEQGSRGSVGVEKRDLPASLWTTLETTSPPGVKLVDIDGWLEPLRMVKTAEELAKLRENFALTDLGHQVARQVVRAGQREIDVWTEVHSAIQRAAGQRVPLGNDCVVSYRPMNIGGWPLNLELRPHDSLILDLSTLLHGYWSDSCVTYYAGDPTPEQAAMHRVTAEALEFAISLVRPGAVAGDIDRQVRQFIADNNYPVYPHHTGHGVGVTGHEGPRIVPYNDELLQEGMVVLLEPGIYLPGQAGVRLEDAVLVTADGAELLTHHDKSLP